MALEMSRPSRTLKDRVAIITGAGAAGDGIGNGRAAAILLAEDGCNVVCVDRDLPSAERTAAMIDSEAAEHAQAMGVPKEASGYGRAIAVEADITYEDYCAYIKARALEEWGRIDILFNCVGIGGAPGTAVDVDMDAWARGMETNVGSMVRMVKEVVPVMAKNSREKGYAGSIINMGSVAGLRGGTPSLLYPTSKGAVVNMTRAMAVHHANDGIRVNCLCPGMLYTPMMYATGGAAGGGEVTMPDEARQARKNRSLLKTEGNGWDVGAAVRWLASDQSRWVTGLILELDAGATCATSSDLPRGASTGG